jgi:hypothetical protein
MIETLRKPASALTKIDLMLDSHPPIGSPDPVPASDTQPVAAQPVTRLKAHLLKGYRGRIAGESTQAARPRAGSICRTISPTRWPMR